MSEQPKEYLVDILKVDVKLEKYVDDFATFSKWEKEETVKEIHDLIVACSRPHTAPVITRELRNELLCEAITALNSESGFDYHVRDWLAIHDAAIASKARENVLGLARDMYGLMMCVEKTNTDEFMEYYAERMKGLKEQYESLRLTQQQAGDRK